MKYRRNHSVDGSMMTKALGRMVGLLLSLYVFDTVIDAVAPSMWSCANAAYPTLVTATATITTAYCTNGTTQVAATGLTFFGTAMTFVGNLFPVVGILGAFEIIYSALRQARLV